MAFLLPHQQRGAEATKKEIKENGKIQLILLKLGRRASLTVHDIFGPSKGGQPVNEADFASGVLGPSNELIVN